MCLENYTIDDNIIFSLTQGHAVNPSQKLLSDPRSAAMTTILIRVLQLDYHRRINWSMETDRHTHSNLSGLGSVCVTCSIFIRQRQAYCHSAKATLTLCWYILAADMKSLGTI